MQPTLAVELIGCRTYWVGPAFWFPVENREEPIKSVLCGVRPVSVRHGLSQKPLRGFFRNPARSWG